MTLPESLTALKDIFGETESVEPPSPLLEYQPKIAVEVLWDERAGTGAGEQRVNLVPAVESGRVYVADREGLLQARDAGTGRLIWEIETEHAFSAGPSVSAGRLILGTSEGDVVVFQAADGTPLWNVAVSSEVLAIPRAAEGIVVIRTLDGKLTGLDEASGRQVWFYEHSVPALTLRGTGSPVITRGRVIDGQASGKLVALQLGDGKLIWETNVAIPRGRSEVERLVDINSDALVVDDVIFAASYQGGIAAVSAPDGELLWWREDVSSAAGMAADERYLYLTDEASDVWEFDQRNAAAIWRNSELHRRALTAPVIYKDTIVLGDFEGYLHWLHPEDGRQLNRVRIDSDGIEVAPVVVGDVIYVYGNGGVLAAVRTK